MTQRPATSIAGTTAIAVLPLGILPNLTWSFAPLWIATILGWLWASIVVARLMGELPDSLNS